MADIRFINKNRTSVDIATVRKRFHKAAVDAKLDPMYASAIWYDALEGDPVAREQIEQLCDIKIVDSDTGSGSVQ